jgi:hypothetical protein
MLVIAAGTCPCQKAYTAELPDTGISGVYEAMIGTDDAELLVKYFAEFGFSQVAEGSFTSAEALEVYGVDSALRSIRMQNGEIDSDKPPVTEFELVPVDN